MDDCSNVMIPLIFVTQDLIKNHTGIVHCTRKEFKQSFTNIRQRCCELLNELQGSFGFKQLYSMILIHSVQINRGPKKFPKVTIDGTNVMNFSVDKQDSVKLLECAKINMNNGLTHCMMICMSYSCTVEDKAGNGFLKICEIFKSLNDLCKLEYANKDKKCEGNKMKQKMQKAVYVDLRQNIKKTCKFDTSYCKMKYKNIQMFQTFIHQGCYANCKHFVQENCKRFSCIKLTGVNNLCPVKNTEPTNENMCTKTTFNLYQKYKFSTEVKNIL